MNDRPVILAVDDSPASLELLVEILSNEGYVVRPADGGELALAAIESSPPDLVLLDVHMPGIDGLEVCRRVKAHAATRHVPIILVSAFASFAGAAEGLRLGAADYVIKPYRAEELLARTRTQLELGRARAEAKRLATELRTAREALRRLEILLAQTGADATE